MIKAGDLVGITRPTSCCNADDDLGEVHRVVKISEHIGQCSECRWVGRLRVAFLGDGTRCVPVERLTKFDPPAFDESTPRLEEIET